MAEVDVFLKEEWPALGDSEALEKQLEQCTVSITCLIGNYSILLNEPSLYRSYTYFCIRLLFLKINSCYNRVVFCNVFEPLAFLSLRENSV